MKRIFMKKKRKRMIIFPFSGKLGILRIPIVILKNFNRLQYQLSENSKKIRINPLPIIIENLILRNSIMRNPMTK